MHLIIIGKKNRISTGCTNYHYFHRPNMNRIPRLGAYLDVLLFAVVTQVVFLFALPFHSASVAYPALIVDYFGLTFSMGIIALIGIELTAVFSFKPAKSFNALHYLMYGQFFLMIYIYLRSLVSNVTGLPGISVYEILILACLIPIHRWKKDRHGLETFSWGIFGSLLGSNLPFRVTCYSLWAIGLAYFLVAKMPLLYTPSSDPDIHAYYLREFMVVQKIFFTMPTEPQTIMGYISGFNVLNYIWSMFNTLTPVQMVNIQGYLQAQILLGCLLGLFIRPGRAKITDIATVLVTLWLGSLMFNSMLIPGRTLLEGTPRLSHTLLMLFPLIHLYRERSIRGVHLAIVLIGLALGFLFNPAHGPPGVILVFSFGLAYLLPAKIKQPRDLATTKPPGQPLNPPKSTLPWVLLGLITCLLLVSSDTYYLRVLGINFFTPTQKSIPQKLTPNGFFSPKNKEHKSSRNMKTFFTGLYTQFDRSRFIPAHVNKSRQTISWVVLITCGFLVCLMALYLALVRKRTFHPFFPLLKGYLIFVLAMHVYLVLMGNIVDIGNPYGKLFLSYSLTSFNQIKLHILVVFLIITLLLVFKSFSWLPLPKFAATTSFMTLPILILAMFYLSIPLHNKFYPTLTASSLGKVFPHHQQIYAWLDAYVPHQERIMIPVKFYANGFEDWIMPYGVGRGIGHYTHTKTAFYYGIDGFRAPDFRQHLRRRLDINWLRKNKINWVLDSSFRRPYPIAQLKSYFRLKFKVQESSIWQLRENDESHFD